jgi:Lon protease-like protein
VKVEELDGGRKNILATGEDRFVVSSYDRKNEYLVGDVEYLEMVEEDPQVLEEAGTRLFPLIDEYLELLSTSSIIQTETLQLPSDPIGLAYIGAFLLQIAPHQKQRLLELVSGIELLNKVHKHYLREIPLAKALLDSPPPGLGLDGRMN